MLPGRKPTKAEQAWMDSIVQLGCIVCRTKLHTYTPAEIHHLEGKTKPGAHKRTLGLCYWHHRAPNDNHTAVSFHANKKAWRERYGHEDVLLEKTKGMLKAAGNFF